MGKLRPRRVLPVVGDFEQLGVIHLSLGFIASRLSRTARVVKSVQPVGAELQRNFRIGPEPQSAC